jgi:EmrB/QacA subfamily drug resistance transporter
MPQAKQFRARWWILLVVQLSCLVASIDSTIVNVSLPIIARETHAGLGLAQWVISGYLLTVMMGMLIAGRLADILGRNKVFLSGFIIFTAGSLFCAAAPNCRWLVAARIIQALGAAGLFANSDAILSATFEGSQKGFALGLSSSIVAVGYALGYVLGGLLTQYMSWRSIFYVNLPLGCAGVWLCKAFLPPDPLSGRKDSLYFFDWKGALLSSIGLGCLVLGADGIVVHGLDARELLILLGGLGLLLFFISGQLSIKEPFLHLKLFEIQNVSVGLGCLFFFTATLASTSFVFPFYLQGILKLSGSQTGLALAPYSLALCCFAPLTGWLSARLRPGWMSASGFVVGVLVCVMYSRIAADSSFLWVALGQFGLGLSGAAFLSPNRVVVLSSVPQHSLGEASALIQSVRFLGLSAGTMMASLVFEFLLKPFGGLRAIVETAGAKPTETAPFVNGLHILFPVTALLLALGALASAWNALYPDRNYRESLE